MKMDPIYHTFSGIRFDLLNPTIDMIDIHDIAHSLSLQCRWNGHCKHFFSIAEHSYHTSFLVPEELALHGLLHDAAEAYVGDIITPLKDQLSGIREIEHRILHLIFESFGVRNSLSDIKDVKLADATMVPTEAWQILQYPEKSDWLNNFPKPASISLECWKPNIAKAVFINRFFEIIDNKKSIAV